MLLAPIWFFSLIVAPSNIMNLTRAQPHHVLLPLRNYGSLHERLLEGATLKGRAPQMSTAQIRSDTALLISGRPKNVWGEEKVA